MKAFFSLVIISAVAVAWYLTPQATPKRRLAPAGTYFLREYYRIETTGGITGWVPGQELHQDLRASTAEGGKTVTDGIYMELVPDSMLTQDMDEAAAIRLADQGKQDQEQAVAATLSAQNAAHTQAIQINSANNIALADARQTAGSAFFASGSRLGNTTQVGGGAGYPVYTGYPVYVTGSTGAANVLAAAAPGAATGAPRPATGGSTTLRYMNTRSNVPPLSAAKPTPAPPGIAR